MDRSGACPVSTSSPFSMAMTSYEVKELLLGGWTRPWLMLLLWSGYFLSKEAIHGYLLGLSLPLSKQCSQTQISYGKLLFVPVLHSGSGSHLTRYELPHIVANELVKQIANKYLILMQPANKKYQTTTHIVYVATNHCCCIYWPTHCRISRTIQLQQ